MDEKVTLIVEVSPEKRQQIEDELEGKAKLLNDLRRSIHEAMSGQTMPISELWKILDDDK